MKYKVTTNETFEIVSGETTYDVLDRLNRASNLGKMPQVTQAGAASVTIDPYKMYDFGTLSTAMTISFDTTKEVEGFTKEYALRFVAGSGCSVTLPNTVMYANGVAPTYTTGRTYEINVINGCAVVGEFY